MLVFIISQVLGGGGAAGTMGRLSTNECTYLPTYLAMIKYSKKVIAVSFPTPPWSTS